MSGKGKRKPIFTGGGRGSTIVNCVMSDVGMRGGG